MRRLASLLRQPIMISEDGADQCLCARMAMEQGPASAGGIEVMIPPMLMPTLVPTGILAWRQEQEAPAAGGKTAVQ